MQDTIINALRRNATDEAVAAALANGENAALALSVERWDARSLPLANGSVECIACNLPWDPQVAIEGGEATFYAALCAEMERVLAPSGQVALLTNRPELLPLRGAGLSGTGGNQSLWTEAGDWGSITRMT